MQKTVLITGITGQDGSYLAELMLKRGCRVYGMIRRSSTPNTPRIDHIYDNPNLTLIYGDLTDASSVFDIVDSTLPDEIYNLGGQSHVKASFDIPQYTLNAGVMGTLHLLEAVKLVGSADRTRIYQASSSEMYGNQEGMHNENTRFKPCSPYGVAKLAAHTLAKTYREAYGMHISCGIMFNHESPRRGVTFVTRKITKAVAAIVAGKQEKVELGNLDTWRDWGWAPEYVEAMPRMLEQTTPGDYVIATGHSYRVKDFAQLAFSTVGLNWQDHVVVVDKYMRPTDIDVLTGDPMKARAELGWSAHVGFAEIVQRMVEADMEAK